MEYDKRGLFWTGMIKHILAPLHTYLLSLGDKVCIRNDEFSDILFY